VAKKGTQKKNHGPKTRDAPDAPAPATPQEEAFDFSGLLNQISKCIERLTANLNELKSGGKFSPKLLESIEVSPDKSGPAKKLREMAQMVAKGRHVNIILYDLGVSSWIPSFFPD
jgi:ribosome recycling factor